MNALRSRIISCCAAHSSAPTPPGSPPPSSKSVAALSPRSPALRESSQTQRRMGRPQELRLNFEVTYLSGIILAEAVGCGDHRYKAHKGEPPALEGLTVSFETPPARSSRSPAQLASRSNFAGPAALLLTPHFKSTILNLKLPSDRRPSSSTGIPACAPSPTRRASPMLGNHRDLVLFAIGRVGHALAGRIFRFFARICGCPVLRAFRRVGLFSCA